MAECEVELKEIQEIGTDISTFQSIWINRQLSILTFDDDNDYKIGQILFQKEQHRQGGRYTGRWHRSQISAITRLDDWIEDVEYSWVILHLDPKTIQSGLEYLKK